MSTRRKIVVGLLALIGFAIGFFGNVMLVSIKGSFGGIVTACRMLETAEQAKLISTAQRGEIADAFVASIGKSTASQTDERRAQALKQLGDGLRGDCKLTPPQ